MQMKCGKKALSGILCMTLIVAMACYTTGCNGKAENENVAPAQTETKEDAKADGSILGEGEKEFSFTVTDKEGEKTQFEIHTDQETVGDALTELGVIEGEDGEYGLYVTTVNGVTADFEKDGVYWAFYINGEYAQTGVDVTPITEGDEYSFQME